ncbi:digeranylgeranylglycerophospholipid reductase [Methanocella sp. CWC-04]|uniref:Digeranylgeranylglycerophospholipid reductase n=1 Tax=Methanooceanicella nereidis TaxID=2052831 RepID=A0AAP2RA77_9EURY|nr:NAD(P)/FAD-dependent oxidoreductase [Methanocella sp. CWC-04]MCD1293573.1 digeranylgeranylglycerophospholipid reductase [Methanocella sp. CWC-04]
MKDKYDVIVVGAGPSGSIAARTAAEKGLEVLLIEKRQEIGEPVRCGEGVPRNALLKFTDIDPKWVCSKISGARLFSPDGNKFELREKNSDTELGYVLDRKIFDRDMARSAANAGAEVMVKTQATSLLMDKGQVCGIRGISRGECFEIAAPVVIGADGVESKIGRWAGIDTTLKLKHAATCAQFHLTGIDIDPSCCDFYFGSSVAPGCYAWVFPKGKDEANVGLGMLASMTDRSHPIQYLTEFVNARFPGSSILESVAGIVPVQDTLPCISTGGMMLTGDAARLSDPLTGAGIISAMASGRISGNVAADAIRSGDVSASSLAAYDREIFDTIGRMISRNYKLAMVVSRMNDSSLNIFFGTLKSRGMEKVPLSFVSDTIFNPGMPLFKILSKIF